MESILLLSSCRGDWLLCNTGSAILRSNGGSISKVHSKQEVTSLKGLLYCVHRVQKSSWQRKQREQREQAGKVK